jgi:uncharacterized membrane protein
MNIQTNAQSKCYAEDEIQIDAPVEKVYGKLCDITHWPQWQSSVKKAHIEGKAEEGKPFEWTASGMKIKSKLHTVNPNKEIGWTGRMMWIKAIHNWELTGKNGQTHVKVTESMQGLGSGSMLKTLKKGMRKSLEDLKNYCETFKH